MTLTILTCKFCHKTVYDLNNYAVNHCGHGYGFTVKEEFEFNLPEEHTSSPDCWCNPILDHKDPVTGAEVWIHREKEDAN